MKLKALVASLVTVAIMGTGISAFGQADQIATYAVSVTPKVTYVGYWDQTIIQKKMRTKGYVCIPLAQTGIGIDLEPFFQPYDGGACPLLFFYWNEGKATVCQYFGSMGYPAGVAEYYPFAWLPADTGTYMIYGVKKNCKTCYPEVLWSLQILANMNQGMQQPIDLVYPGAVSDVSFNLGGKFNQNCNTTYKLNKLVPTTLSDKVGGYAFGYGENGYELAADPTSIMYQVGGKIRATLDVKRSTASTQSYNVNLARTGDETMAMTAAADAIALSLNKKVYPVTL